MAPRKNPLKLNKLQLRTLALAQVLANDPSTAQRDSDSGDAVLLGLPHASAVGQAQAAALQNPPVGQMNFAGAAIARLDLLDPPVDESLPFVFRFTA